MVMAARTPRVCLGLQVVLSNLILEDGTLPNCGCGGAYLDKRGKNVLFARAPLCVASTHASRMVRGGIGAERDWMLCGAGTCILFGDGCGAVVLTTQEHEQPCSLLGCSMASDGLGQKHLNVRTFAHQCFCFFVQGCLSITYCIVSS